MPLTDYVNFNPAPEATGGYNTGGLGLTVDDLMNANRAIDFYNQANTMGITPFEANQIYRNQLNPTSVSTGFAASGGAETNPFLSAILGPTNISATGTAGGLPANIFQGPLPTLGGAGINALYNLGSAGLNYLGNIGVNQVALGNLPAGNIGMETGFNPNYPNLSTAGVTITNPGELTGNVTFDTGAANIGQTGAGERGSMTVGNALTGGPASAGASDRLSMVGGPTMMGPFNVNESLLPNVSLGAGTTPSTPVSQPPITSGGGGTPASTGTTSTSSGVSTLPAYNVNDTRQTDAQYQQALEQFKRANPDFNPTGVQLPPMIVPGTRVNPSTTATTTATTRINVPSGPVDFSKITPPVNFVGPVVRPGGTTAQTTVTTGMTTTGTGTTDMTGGITYNPNAGQVAAGTTQRDLAAELAKSYAALSGQQGNLMGMYGGIYQNLLGQTAIPQAAQSSLQQMALDQAKLQRIQSGQMNAEDIRQAQQAAREAYGARGQVMGQGAIGAEILNREAIRQQRENEARQAYQASMGNVFNAAQLQTGNIFSPIGQLVSGTFNPLGAYPQDVYSSNVNAQLARDIAAANNAAAIEAAKYGATQAKQAATTGAVGNILTKLLGLG